MKQKKSSEYKFEDDNVAIGDSNPLSIFGLTNQEQYQKSKSEQTTYTFSGKFTREEDIDGFILDLSNPARVFFLARYALSVTKVIINYTESDGSNFLQVEKLKDGQVPGTGINILKAPYNITLPKNISYIKEQEDLLMTPVDRSLEKGERLAIKFGATPSTFENLTVLVEYVY